MRPPARPTEASRRARPPKPARYRRCVPGHAGSASRQCCAAIRLQKPCWQRETGPDAPSRPVAGPATAKKAPAPVPPYAPGSTADAKPPQPHPAPPDCRHWPLPPHPLPNRPIHDPDETPADRAASHRRSPPCRPRRTWPSSAGYRPSPSAQHSAAVRSPRQLRLQMMREKRSRTWSALRWRSNTIATARTKYQPVGVTCTASAVNSHRPSFCSSASSSSSGLK